jgi:hypothetical protein
MQAGVCRLLVGVDDASSNIVEWTQAIINPAIATHGETFVIEAAKFPPAGVVSGERGEDLRIGRNR